MVFAAKPPDVWFSSSRRAVPAPAVTRPVPAAPVPPVETSATEEVSVSSRSGTLYFKGRSLHYANAKDAMILVLTELAKEDGTFLQRCSQHPDAKGTRRQYVARTADELYPTRPDLRHHHEALPDGWLVATNLNNGLKRQIIRVACEVAGLTFGADVKVEF